MDDQQPPAGIEIGSMRGNSSVSNNLLLNNAGGGLRVGQMDDHSRADNNIVGNINSQDFKDVVEAVRKLNDPEATTALEQIVVRNQDVGNWKKLIDKVGPPAGRLALQITTGAVAEVIKRYLHDNGIII